MTGAGEPTCGLTEALVFLGALIAGTSCSLCSKVLLGMRGGRAGDGGRGRGDRGGRARGPGATRPRRRVEVETRRDEPFAPRGRRRDVLAAPPQLGEPDRRVRGAAAAASRIVQSRRRRSVGLSGEEEAFQNPLFQTWGMFLGMIFALPVHFIREALAKRKKRRGYETIDAKEPEFKEMPASTYLLLAIPSLFDLAATALCMYGLTYFRRADDPRTSRGDAAAV